MLQCYHSTAGYPAMCLLVEMPLSSLPYTAVNEYQVKL